jgi:hypothetical protein
MSSLLRRSWCSAPPEILYTYLRIVYIFLRSIYVLVIHISQYQFELYLFLYLLLVAHHQQTIVRQDDEMGDI